jgi:4-hydroxy 2-oxovalerate aldolase
MVKLLDCTLRDGGYVNDWKFTDQQVTECYSACSDAGLDYMEIGFRNRRTESINLVHTNANAVKT